MYSYSYLYTFCLASLLNKPKIEILNLKKQRCFFRIFYLIILVKKIYDFVNQNNWIKNPKKHPVFLRFKISIFGLFNRLARQKVYK